jgi:hypothetical protein
MYVRGFYWKKEKKGNKKMSVGALLKTENTRKMK